jgi:hypothetical protein
MTCRDLIRDALRELDVIAPGDDLISDDLEVAMARLQGMVMAVAEARGPWSVVDVTADYTAGEDERVRVQAGAVITVTLPNTVDDGVGGQRAPRDGARVDIVGQSRAMSIYRSDTNSWITATDLGVDDDLPFNGAYHWGLAAMLAVDLANAWPGRASPTALTLARAAEAKAQLATTVGVPRAVVAAEYF